MKLYLDSTDNKKTLIRLDGEEFTKDVPTPRDQNVFGFLVECLKAKKVTAKDITEVEVNPGPGSFTGTRIGITVGNALAYGLNIKINGQEPPIEPVYSSPPNITTPKSAF